MLILKLNCKLLIFYCAQGRIEALGTYQELNSGGVDIAKTLQKEDGELEPDNLSRSFSGSEMTFNHQIHSFSELLDSSFGNIRDFYPVRRHSEASSLTTANLNGVEEGELESSDLIHSYSGVDFIVSRGSLCSTTEVK